MRWDSLRLAGDGGQDGGATPALFERAAVARTFDTPGFRGMTFYEVHSKSIISKVPEASRVPFRWTINPYRGCSHACRYCVSGDTPVLMADGRTKPIADLRPGDAIYGTVRRGRDRRYVKTTVLAHWQTVKRGYRVTLEDGTSLIASGDHRFLTGRGWRYVTGTELSAGRRRHLMPGSKLLGPGRFAEGVIEDVAVQSDAGLKVTSIEPLGLELPMYDITTGTGDFIANGVISHNCFARNTHTYLDMDAGHDFDSQIVVKVNAVELLRKELAAPRWRGEHIAMGTNVDCYQRAEGRYGLMPGIIQALTEAANPFSILTKGTLILRDIDLLAAAAEVTDVGLNVSVGFVDKELSRLIESGTPAPERRLAACAELNQRGLSCGVLMGPVIPYLTDSPATLERTVRQIAASGAAHVTPIVLHLRPGAREWFLSWLQERRPDLVGPYAQLYGRRAYAPADYQRKIADQVTELAQKYGVGRASPAAARRLRVTPRGDWPDGLGPSADAARRPGRQSGSGQETLDRRGQPDPGAQTQLAGAPPAQTPPTQTPPTQTPPAGTPPAEAAADVQLTLL
jgi:DNA repair photolyase